MPAFNADPGMPYWIDLSTSDVRKSTYFYSQLLGWEISAESEDSPYQIARVQGLPVAGFIPHDGAMPETWVTYFFTRDIEKDVVNVAKLGGRVLSVPTQVQLGRMAVLADASGALFGLIEPAGEEAFVAAGEPGTPVWHELSATSNYESAIDFYHGLLDWEVVQLTRDDGTSTYATAMSDGAPFAGLRDSEGQFPPQVPGFWQSFIGVEDLGYACRRVVELGGEVIREPANSEFGPIAIVADSTGATLMLAEVDVPVDEGEISESDDILNL